MYMNTYKFTTIRTCMECVCMYYMKKMQCRKENIQESHAFDFYSLSILNTHTNKRILSTSLYLFSELSIINTKIYIERSGMEKNKR